MLFKNKKFIITAIILFTIQHLISLTNYFSSGSIGLFIGLPIPFYIFVYDFIPPVLAIGGAGENVHINFIFEYFIFNIIFLLAVYLIYQLSSILVKKKQRFFLITSWILKILLVMIFILAFLFGILVMLLFLSWNSI